VARGAMETLNHANAVKVSSEDFLNKQFDVPVVCQIGPQHYTRRKDCKPFDFDHFIRHPYEYESAFEPYTRVADILITAHFWDPQSPVFFTLEDMKKPDFSLSVIADVSCDIDGPIPSTLRATTIADPFYGFNPHTGKEERPFKNPDNITVMSVDNLPGELPRDAATDFGRQLINNIMNDLIDQRETAMLERATICRNGKLTERYQYLEDYLKR
jgi:saccharopine dehydrogenase (NAD+, L-lysine-forming)